LLPSSFIVVKVTVYKPGVLYRCEGFSRVDVFRSPKSHCQPVGLPVLVSVN
jgi:hypothetical protein